MDRENDSFSSTRTARPVDPLHALLEDAERRKEADLARKSRIASRIIVFPALAFFAWAGIFLLQYRDNKEAPPPKPVAVAPAPKPAPESTELDRFRPEALRSVKPAASGAKQGGIVDHEDLKFAMELLNFCQSPNAGKDTKH